MYVPGSLHVTQNVVLQLLHRLERVWDILILLNVTYHIGRFCPLGKIDCGSLLYDGRNTIFNEGQVRQVDTYGLCEYCGRYGKVQKGVNIPKNGIHGGLAICRLSLYSAKFFVLSMSLRMPSNVA